MNDLNQVDQHLTKTIHRLINLSAFLFAAVVVLCLLLLFGVPKLTVFKAKPTPETQLVVAPEVEKLPKAVFDGIVWNAPVTDELEKDKNREQLKYGRELIANTSTYLGPRGSVAQISNGMNCQNCHLQGGTVPFGNNYGAVASTYPKYRARSGKVEDVYKRVEDCFERSLNGSAPKRGSREMEALVAYINWVGKAVKKGEKPVGSGIYELAFLDRPASPEKGKLAYTAKCQSCHQADGAGQFNVEKTAYTYPPLWGKNSYNHGAGLFRLSRFAGYIKTNMPLGATYQNPQLTDEEAWDIAAYIESLPRPIKNVSKDWPKITEKPVDHPFGPFADNFSEQQHKYGPFAPIAAAKKSNNAK